ncbi:hypothetical protein D3C76_1683710 [compost metagenome]
MANLKLRLCPSLLVKDFAEDLHGIPNLSKRRVQRSESEAHDLWFTVITDNPSCDQGLDDRVAFRMLETYVAAAPGVFPRGDQS